MVSREVVKEVKTLYGNLISVQGVYVKRAFTRKANLKLKYKDDFMIVPLSQLHKPIFLNERLFCKTINETRIYGMDIKKTLCKTKM